MSAQRKDRDRVATSRALRHVEERPGFGTPRWALRSRSQVGFHEQVGLVRPREQRDPALPARHVRERRRIEWHAPQRRARARLDLGFERCVAVPRHRNEAAALAKCSGKHCKVVASVRGACMAFAVELSNPCGPYGFATGPALARAQNRALRECQRNGGKDCVIRTYACD